jgi:hypothetical protein
MPTSTKKTATEDSFVEALGGERKKGGSTSAGKIVDLFGESPRILEAIRNARTVQKLSYDHIAMTLTKTAKKTIGEDVSVSGAAVKTWLNGQDIK